jgi:hypothetical protein
MQNVGAGEAMKILFVAVCLLAMIEDAYAYSTGYPQAVRNNLK